MALPAQLKKFSLRWTWFQVVSVPFLYDALECCFKIKIRFSFVLSVCLCSWHWSLVLVWEVCCWLHLLLYLLGSQPTESMSCWNEFSSIVFSVYAQNVNQNKTWLTMNRRNLVDVFSVHWHKVDFFMPIVVFFWGGGHVTSLNVRSLWKVIITYCSTWSEDSTIPASCCFVF